LLQSKAFAQLPSALQQQIANDMVKIGDYLAAPDGIRGNKLPTATAVAAGNAEKLALGLEDSPSTYERDAAEVEKIGGSKFQAGAAREGAEVAGLLLEKVNFPTFVASLIQGVFHAIVQASIEQMEAYGKLVASVAKSLNQFRDENVSENQGRDYLVEQFPDTFEIGVDGFGGQAQPRVKLQDGVDEGEALKQVNERLPIQGGPLKSLDLEDEDTERKLTQAARTQLATSRQQLLATMVLMGINRIVVTEGKISAKIMYDFQAKDTRRLQRSAAAFDYARGASGQIEKLRAGEEEYEKSREGGERKYKRGKEGEVESERRDADYYAKGKYKYSEQPIMTAMSTASEATDAALQTRAQLAGVVDVNFKSDYFPLEKMADSFQISQIQTAARPGRGAAGGAPAPGGSPAAGTQAGGGAAGATPPPASPAPAR
jgi:hypothetical protein